jgi:DNA repair protein RecO (recombination protein O)
MRPARVYRAEAIVLRHRKIGEADKVLTLYSAEHGKFDAVAKGVRRPTSRKSGHLEELSHSSLLLAHGRTLDIVTQCEVLDSFASLRSDLRRLSAALYLAELVDRFSAEQQENIAVYRALLESLHGLAAGHDTDLTLRWFEIQLLDDSGFQPQLRLCSACHGPVEAVVNVFSPAAGGVVCTNCRAGEAAVRPLTVNALKVMRLLQSRPYSDVLKLRMPQGLTAEIEDHLHRYIRHVLEHEVRSREFFRSLRDLTDVQTEHVVAPMQPVVT